MVVQEELLAWVRGQLQALGLAFNEAKPIEGDAGFRQYIRLDTDPAMLAVYGPPMTEKHTEFVAISEHWRTSGVHAPRVFAHDLAQGFLLVEDLGATSLADALANRRGRTTPAEIYAPVLAQLRTLQLLTPKGFYPQYSAHRLQQEMALFEPWFVEGLLGYTLSECEKASLQVLYQHLINSAQAQPQVIVHRDLHCRNIQCSDTVAQDAQLGFIDFQDAMIGPITYDWVSLLKDCYQQWPASFVSEQAMRYNQALPARLRLADEALLETLDLMGLQRHLKVLGIFARLSLRDGKMGYLHDLPLVVAYVRDVCGRYEALQPFLAWFDRVLLPLCALQPWYRCVVIQP
ncbi:aminoglycoside phosphotransferase family protein [Marinagarivorans algicola]|uniref:aminoglycoside phosphotransferase family protein n=1 Tax=Marinagarivorans algicola TaxID=1513270 RepID=UPI0006B9D019|nr:phosphotransferase [Marinagarivorans algicola]